MNAPTVSRTRRRAGRSVAVALVGAVAALGFGVSTTVGAQAATPTTLYVSQTGLNSGTCTSGSPCATVTYALTEAPSGATIEVSGTIDDHVTITTPVTSPSPRGLAAPPVRLGCWTGRGTEPLSPSELSVQELSA
jgi:hypothetical protein